MANPDRQIGIGHGRGERQKLPDPHVVFRRTVSGLMQDVGVDGRVIDQLMGAIETASHEMQRGISARAGINPSQEDFELQALQGEVGPPPISADAIDNKRRGPTRDPDGFGRRRGW